jgi:hypothetical protein
MEYAARAAEKAAQFFERETAIVAPAHGRDGLAVIFARQDDGKLRVDAPHDAIPSSNIPGVEEERRTGVDVREGGSAAGN